VLSHAPRRTQSMMMMIDAFQVEGITELAVDSIFMMPHLGVLSTVHADAATEVFEKDCLIRLGTSIAPVGKASKSGSLATIRIKGAGINLNDVLKVGDIRRVELNQDATAEVVIEPARGIDVGAGPGQLVSQTIRGGVCGVVLDGRGRRPLTVATEAAARLKAADRWNQELEIYPSV